MGRLSEESAPSNVGSGPWRRPPRPTPLFLASVLSSQEVSGVAWGLVEGLLVFNPERAVAADELAVLLVWDMGHPSWCLAPDRRSLEPWT